MGLGELGELGAAELVFLVVEALEESFFFWFWRKKKKEEEVERRASSPSPSSSFSQPKKTSSSTKPKRTGWSGARSAPKPRTRPLSTSRMDDGIGTMLEAEEEEEEEGCRC